MTSPEKFDQNGQLGKIPERVSPSESAKGVKLSELQAQSDEFNPIFHERLEDGSYTLRSAKHVADFVGSDNYWLLKDAKTMNS